MKVCLYEILGLERDCTEPEIKRAYRSLALQWHPDKNLNQKEVAEERFKLIQEAYQTLSDPEERAFYDGHRNQILREEEPDLRASEDPDIDLGQFLDDSCFCGFDDSSTRSFFVVFAAVFIQIDELELRSDPSGARIRYPAFGNSTTPWPQVNDFYKEWSNFSTCRSFSWANQWKLSEASERRVKRLMEKDNKAAQSKAKRSYIDQVTTLVLFIRKRDPRVIAHLAAVAKEREEKEMILSQKLEQQKNAQKAKRESWLAQEQSRILEGERRMREAYGDLIEESPSATEDEPEFECMACDKVFKSEKQYLNHENSKKHRMQVERLRKDLQLEETLLHQLRVDEDAEEKSASDAECDAGDPTPTVMTEPELCANGQSGSEMDSDHIEEQQHSVSQPKKKRKNKNARKQANFGYEVVDDEEISAAPALQEPEDSESPLAETKKMARRRRTKQKSKADTTSELEQGDAFRCDRCSSTFQSKTQLFRHLNKNPSHKSLK